MFAITLRVVVITLLYMMTGYVGVKWKKSFVTHAKSFSYVLLYVCAPCMVIRAFEKIDFSVADAKKLGLFFVVTLVLQVVFMLILVAILHKKYGIAKYRVMSFAAVAGNCGFAGLPIVTALFPNEPIVASYSAVMTISMNLVVYTVGIYMLTADKKYISLKSAILNPMTIAFLISMPLYFFNIHLPQLLAEPMDLLGKMSTPLCMMILGMRCASVDLRTFFRRPVVYAASALKLVIFPLFCYLCVLFIPWLDTTFKVCILALSAVPTASVVLSLAEMLDSEQENSANMLLVSTILSVITMPLIMLLA